MATATLTENPRLCNPIKTGHFVAYLEAPFDAAMETA